MEFVGREVEVAKIRSRISGLGPSLTLVVGPRRSGRTALLRNALEGVEHLWYQAAPLPDSDQRVLLVERLRSLLRALDMEEGEVEGSLGEAEWPALFQSMTRPFFRTRRPTVVVLDGWERLVEGRRRLPDDLVEFWLQVRRRGGPFHLVLSSTPGSALEAFREERGPLFRWVDEMVPLGPIPFRSVTGLWSAEGSVEGRRSRGERAGATGKGGPPAAAPGPRERLRTWGIFGGWPEVVRHLDTGRSLRENVLDAVLGEEAPLRRWGSELIEREFQSTGRYASILRALAMGAEEWGEIRDGTPDFGSSGQLAPYIQRLESLEILRSARSLDAGPEARRRRYRISDPFTAFWFRFVLPNLTELELGRGDEVWRRKIAPALDDQMTRFFPQLCREWLARHAHERFADRVDEVGGLWGRGYDLPVAGSFGNRTPLFGVTRWGMRPAGEEVLAEIDRQIDATRYGLWRQGRHRLVFADTPPHSSLRRRAASDPVLHLVDIAEIAGPE